MTQELKQTFLRNKKLLLWGLALTGIVVLFLGGSFLSLAHNKMEKNKLMRRSKQLDVEFEKLQQLKTKLEQEDPELIEQLARTQYHLVKPGEVEFRFTEK